MRRFPALLMLVLGAAAPGGMAHAQAGLSPVDGPKVTASFVAEQDEIRPGGSVTVALREEILEGWHTYWVNPGDSGAPTEIEWHLPEGWSAGEIDWPYPSRMPIGPLMNYGFEDEVLLLLEMTAPADAVAGETVSLPADVNWLVCSDICIPEETSLELTLTIAETPAPPAPDAAALFAAAREKLPAPADFAARYDVGDTRLGLLFENPAFAGRSLSDAVFYPYTDGFVEPAAPQNRRAVSSGLVLETQPGWQIADPERRSEFDAVSGVLVLTAADGGVSAYALSASPGEVPAAPLSASLGIGFVSALFFAFLGGIILNLMPCVLPVLSMKALSLAKKSGVPGAAKHLSLAYGAGVVLTFSLLAAALILFRAGGAAVGWGFQLQQPLFVAVLALVMFAVALNLSGVFEIETGRFAGVGQKFTAKGGMTGSFFTGMLAVVVATPCTAPFMAAALGYAATQSAMVAFAVFLALALGFALPFMALGFSPSVLALLPRPGHWMITFKQILAFPMYGAAAWLVWVLNQQTGASGLFAILGAGLALAFALWAFNASRNAGVAGRLAGHIGAGLAVVAMVLLTARIASSPPVQTATPVASGTLGYETYSATRLADLRAAGTPVFVNATAAWCITCLVNERVALSSERLKAAFDAAGIVAMKADWTNRNTEITALLSEYGRNGVPLYLYFPPQAAAGEVLPQLLTEGIVLAAIEPVS